MSNNNNNNRRINFLTTQIGKTNKNFLQKVNPLFKKSKSKEVLEILEILERKLLNFINTLTFQNLEKKLIELQKIYERIKNISEKILAKQDQTLKDRFKAIYDNYLILFPNFLAKILEFFSSHDLDINNLKYLSFIADNLRILFLNICCPLTDDDPYYIKILEVESKSLELEVETKSFEVQTEISRKIDELTNKKFNKNKNKNFNNKNFQNLKNEQNEYMLREKIVTLLLKIYKKALGSQGIELEKLKKDFKTLIDLYKEKFINPRKNQPFPMNQNTLAEFDILYKKIPLSNNSNLAAGLAKLRINSRKKNSISTATATDLYYA